jgi:RecA/RadA recombinase
MFDSPETTTGGRALKSIRLRLDIRHRFIKDGDRIVGNRTKVSC